MNNTSDKNSPDSIDNTSEDLSKLSGTSVATIADLRRLTRAYTGDAIRAVLEVMFTTNSDRLKLAAAEAVLDRAWGKAPQAPAVREAPQAGQSVDSSDDARLRLIQQLADLARPAPDGRDH